MIDILIDTSIRKNSVQRARGVDIAFGELQKDAESVTFDKHAYWWWSVAAGKDAFVALWPFHDSGSLNEVVSVVFNTPYTLVDVTVCNFLRMCLFQNIGVPEEGSEDLIKSAEEIATALNIQLRLPKTASRQQHGANQPAALAIPKLQKCMEEVFGRYELEGIAFETELWRTFWINKQQQDFESIVIAEFIQEADSFYPKVKIALEILLAMP
ncbi:hypothetical protein EVAR_54409_1 [Eumeta japonica]|uniref:Uncharacterized protein n=1 Tax=Eumeta variegata TaxID=151549 RepID=A0A4C1Y958_EUMVA|nr:hypothetical protein EVAR_54409_1 [Eumeta japonica]